ncbi:MAG: DNA polymerase IV [Methanomicrobiales archaeon]|jgi:DNA polymerase IV (DinB-like DNA polymerase)|nr:DNA polymerase IV [Methanomicrobiales archaeon]
MFSFREEQVILQDLIIGHLDMDSFFASIEIVDHPDLIGKPVIVGARPEGGAGRGVVSTCSYEARAFGISSGMPVSTAFRLCPDGIYLVPRHSRYCEISRDIMSCIADTGFSYEQVSIDEAYLNLSPLHSFEKAQDVCQDLKKRIFREFHLTCSIGIAPSRSYAKIASEQAKPDGFFVLLPKDIIPLLDPMPASIIPGIGKKGIQILEKHGIKTVSDLRKMDQWRAQDLFGSMAQQIYHIVHGYERKGISHIGPASSISKETTFLQDTLDRDLLRETLLRLTGIVHTQMIRIGYSCKTVTLKIRYTGFITRTHAVTLSHPSREYDLLSQTVLHLFDARYEDKAVRLIGVRFSGFDRLSDGQRRLDEFGVES